MQLNTVYDLLFACSDEEIIEEVIKKENYKKRADVYELYVPLLKELRSRNPIQQSDIVLGIDFIIDGAPMPDAVLYNIDDIATGFKRNDVFETITDISVISDEDVEKLIKLNVTPESYGYEYQKWDEILGYRIDKHNAETFGKARLFANVLSEMTFFGLTEDCIDDARKKLQEVSAEVDEILSLPKEEQDKHFVSWEKVKAEFGIESETESEEKKANDY